MKICRKEFFNDLVKIFKKAGIIVIFDEVMTGFRVCKSGAQKLYNIDPDITTLGKVLGGGLPVGAFGGKKEIMNHIAPMGGVYQAGTLSGNPLAMAAGLKTLEIISEKKFFDMLSKKARQLVAGINKVSKKYNLNVTADSEGGMFGIYFTKSRLKNMNDINLSSKNDFLDFFNYMLKHGVFFAPSMYEAGFISSKHSKKDIDYTIKIFEKWAKARQLLLD